MLCFAPVVCEYGWLKLLRLWSLKCPLEKKRFISKKQSDEIQRAQGVDVGLQVPEASYTVRLGCNHIHSISLTPGSRRLWKGRSDDAAHSYVSMDKFHLYVAAQGFSIAVFIPVDELLINKIY